MLMPFLPNVNSVLGNRMDRQNVTQAKNPWSESADISPKKECLEPIEQNEDLVLEADEACEVCRPPEEPRGEPLPLKLDRSARALPLPM
jgi:hypothetical protein